MLSFNLDFSLHAPSPNRAYPAPLHLAQIPLRGTPDTPGTLYEISSHAKGGEQ